jgi:hypothetical protein
MAEKEYVERIFAVCTELFNIKVGRTKLDAERLTTLAAQLQCIAQDMEVGHG